MRGAAGVRGPLGVPQWVGDVVFLLEDGEDGGQVGFGDGDPDQTHALGDLFRGQVETDPVGAGGLG
ncbi:hypothetical protein ACWC9T_12340 [Kitasatospora sp. NPDC001159]